ncbi:MAG: DUF58 domain-containing protein [Planctomycetes bacterium]|nr:DUF58 domain-containing protein [Planctomycetota bacterium]NBY02954.1 DUF58 domain-containing protein [Planctomycetota bacterium]
MADSVTVSSVHDKIQVVKEVKLRKRALLPLGKIFSLFSALLVFIGVYKSINLLSLMGYFLFLTLFFNAILASRRLRNITVKRYFPDQLYAGVPGIYQIEVNNVENKIIPPWYLIDASCDRGKGWAIPSLGAYARYYLQSRIFPLHRGYLELAKLELRGSYPFGLVQKRIWAEQKEKVLVLPKLGLSRPGSLESFIAKLSVLDDTGNVAQFHPLAQEEFHGLRVYRPGDSPRAIHWRTSARRGELMVRELEDFPGDDLLLVVDPGIGNDNELESFISFAATVVHDYCRARGNRMVVVVLDAEVAVFDERADYAFGVKVLRYLAASNACASDLEYRNACSKAVSLMEKLTLPPAVLALRRSNNSDSFEPLKERPAPFLDIKTAREKGIYEPPSLVGES